MHGRQKIQQTEEQLAKKTKERAKKLEIYKNAMENVFAKRASNQLDKDILMTTAQLLLSNPDIGTLWNIRREVLLLMKENGEDFEHLVTKDLDLTENSLKSNPKSYGAWHHRHWLMKETGFSRVSQELDLCSKYLKLDERNFHCWDYRRFLLENSSKMTLDEELSFTTQKIQSNFSNYSSWHLRSTILPKISTNYLQEELDLIKNAAFTDPNDQSVWFYHRWLLKSQLSKDTPNLLFVSEGEPKAGSKVLMCVFNIPITNPSSNDILLQDVLKHYPIASGPSLWSNPWNAHRSKLWTLDLSNFSAQHAGDTSRLSTYKEFPKFFDCETKPKSPEFEQILRSELEWVLELNEVEPGNKWVLSTAILLMRLINFIDFKEQIIDYIMKVMELDPNRSNYYADLHSKYIMEWKLVEMKPGVEEVDLSNLNLASAYYLERLCAVKSVNLTGNQLNDSVSLSALLCCERLVLQK